MIYYVMEWVIGVQDCVDQDPTTRGLALRALCSLRLANFLEYTVSDPVAYCSIGGVT